MEPYGLKTNFRENILTTVKQKRTEDAFPPAYQAQLMVERAGIKYFELLSAVDSDTYNAVQYYTALLAKADLVRAIVTTNFDQNFERALTQSGVNYKSYFDGEGFNEIAKDEDKGMLPVIKIHGCSSSPISMIDTSKQRLQGRSKALENILLQLLQNYHFIFG
ncbi:hypothetical protein BH11BAC3_BH11BAC3_12910 [soil metagenome]